MRGDSTTDYPYSGFNVCDYTGDKPEHIADCRNLLCADLGITPDRLILPRQTHSASVAVIHDGTVPSLDGIDALVTDTPGIALCINTADCAPILLADSQAGVIAAVHSGWRGTLARISAAAVKAMTELGAEPSRIKAMIAPSICIWCYEVGKDVADLFIKEFTYSPELIDNSLDRPHISLSAAVTITLTQAGIKEENIDMTDFCTHCNDEFFSARKLGTHSGRMASVIMLKQ